MGRSIYHIGKVEDGNYKGKPIYQLRPDTLSIISNDENGKIIVDSWIPTSYSVLKEISKATVDHYLDNTPIEGYVAIYFKGGKKSLVSGSTCCNAIKKILFTL